MNFLLNYSLNKEEPSRDEISAVNSFLLVWIPTTVVMWLYVVFSYSVFELSIVGNFGVVFSVLHMAAPIVYRYTKSLVSTGLTISVTALLFQVTFCLHNGGISSPAAIWFTAHPVIISFFGSKKLVVLSVILNAVTVLSLALCGWGGYFPADALSSRLTEVMNVSSLIGLDIIIAVYTLVSIKKSKDYARETALHSDQAESLMRIVSHDINNALHLSTNVTEYLGALNQKSEPEIGAKIAVQLEKLQKANVHISGISTSLRDWMMATSRNYTIRIEKIPVSKIISHVERSYRSALREKQITLSIEDNTVSETRVLADSRGLRYQVIGNLITNAIKFSPNGSHITLRINQNPEFVEFQVADRGVGIPEAKIGKLFEFGKSRSTKGTNGERGSGFGLPLADLLIKLMNGKIWIYSAQSTPVNSSCGTTVTFMIPVTDK